MYRLLLLCVLVFHNAYGQLVWPVHSTVTDLGVGPEDAVHCRLTSPTGTAAFDGFGQCKVNLDRVTPDHAGSWTMEINQLSNMLPVTQTFSAQVTSAAASKPLVSTEVVTEKPLVTVTCSVATAESVQGCVFRGPNSLVVHSSTGASEGRFSFVESSQAGVRSCGLQINNPLTTDLGLWRCDMQTPSDTYYGHIALLCPWAMMDPEVAASVVAEPTLTSQTPSVVVNEGESATLSCYVQAAIRYCYFRAQNGTVFSVTPGLSSSSMEYAGAGFDAGECGVRFRALARTDSGAWSCHVGLTEGEEQRAPIQLNVQEEFTVDQQRDGSQLVIQGSVRGGPQLDYCRFVRMDGLGFTSINVPAGYFDGSSLSQGLCKIRVAAPTILDHHPWTVATRVTGRDDELSMTTRHTIVTLPEQNDDGSSSSWWIYLTVFSVLVVLTAGAFCCKRNRRWAAERAASVRNSFRKEPLRDEKPQQTA